MVIIEHQQQPDDQSCGHTCIAMILGIPVADVVAYTQRHPVLCGGLDTLAIETFMVECRMIFNRFNHNAFTADGHYLVTVPSLNNEGGKHAILLHASEFMVGDIWDPNRGREGMKYYVPSDPRGPLQVEMNGVIDPILVHLGGRLPATIQDELLKSARQQLRKARDGKMDQSEVDKLLIDIDRYVN